MKIIVTLIVGVSLFVAGYWIGEILSYCRAAMTNNDRGEKIVMPELKPMSETVDQQKLIELVIERAEQACRYALKHQNFDSDTDPQYRSGWSIAAEVCERAIRRQVMSHIEDDLRQTERNGTVSGAVPGAVSKDESGER